MDDDVNMQMEGGPGNSFGDGGSDRWNSLDNVAGQGAGVILNYGNSAYNSSGSGSNGYFNSGVGDSPYSSMTFDDSTFGTPDLGSLTFTGNDYSPWLSNLSYDDGMGGMTDWTGGNNYLNLDGGYVPSSGDKAGLYSDTAYGDTDKQFQGIDGLKRYKDAVSPFQQFLKNPIVSTLMSLNPATAVLKAALGGPTSVGGFLGSMFGSTPIGRLAGAFGGSQLANYATEGQFAPVTGSNLGGMAGSLLGMATGNPYGAALGGFAGRQLGGMDFGSMGSSFMPGETGGMPNNIGGTGMQEGGGSMMGMQTPGMGGLGGLPGMSSGGSPNILGTGTNISLLGAGATAAMGYNNNRMLGNQIKTLEGLFGQNSSYAQAMRQQLERRDAAAGRRSQYGPREVELQAALAGNAARLQPGLQQLYGQKMGNTNLVLQSLLRNPSALSGVKDAGGWLLDLFKQGNGSTVINNPYWNGGGFQSGNEGMGD